MDQITTPHSQNDLKNDVIHLANQIQNLENENHDLQDKNQNLSKKLIEVEATNAKLMAYLKLAQNNRFGTKSEKISDEDTPMLPGIGQVFDEASVETKKPVKRDAQGGRKPLPDHLPRTEVTHDIQDHDKICSCGHPLHCIGKEESEQIEVVPAQVKIVKNVRLKYGCKACEDTVVTAPMPAQAIPKSMAGPGLLAHILVSKFDDHLPLYRQCEMWERMGVHLDRTTMGRWVMACGNLLTPLVDLMQQDIVASDSIQADETVVQVLNEKGRKPRSKSYMWVFKTAGDKRTKIVYHYSSSRSSDELISVLSHFNGYLQSDGYKGYSKFADNSSNTIINLGCWSHARRKFIEITKVTPKKGIAFEVIQRIGKLYDIERQAKVDNLSFEEIWYLRQDQAKPILDDLKSFLLVHQEGIPPKSLLGLAIGYTLRNWDALIVYLERGDLQIDNNATERCIKPFVIGRRNWLFKGTVAGARSSAVIYSLIETAKSYGLNPFDYLKDVLIELPQRLKSGEAIDNLLPYNWEPNSSET